MRTYRKHGAVQPYWLVRFRLSRKQFCCCMRPPCLCALEHKSWTHAHIWSDRLQQELLLLCFYLSQVALVSRAKWCSTLYGQKVIVWNAMSLPGAKLRIFARCNIIWSALKTNWGNHNLTRCSKYHWKSLIQHCERSELRLHFEKTKVD